MDRLKKGKDWEKKGFVLETLERFPVKMRFSMMSFDGPIEDAPVVGEKVRVRFTVEAREVNDNWYNDIKAYQIEKLA
jgi:hypothetical protein